MAKGLGVPRTQPRWQEQAGQYLGQAGNSYARMDKAQYRPEYEKSAGGALQSAVSMGMAGMEVGGMISGMSGGAAAAGMAYPAAATAAGATGAAGAAAAAGAAGAAGSGAAAGAAAAGAAGAAGSGAAAGAAAGPWGLVIGAAIGLGMYLFS
jgi:hypothetical protein